jgi:hypothetical protein
MTYRNVSTQRSLFRAKTRALERLKNDHPDEYLELYNDEMLSEGFVRKPGGQGHRAPGGWRKMTDDELRERGLIL